MKRQIPTEFPAVTPKDIYSTDKKPTESPLVHFKAKPAPPPVEELDDLWDNVPV